MKLDAVSKKPWSTFAWLFCGFIATATALSVAKGAQAAESEDKIESKFIEPIITEETMPNEPKELTVRFGTDYGQRGSEASAELPYLQCFYGIVERLGATLDLSMAYHKDGAGASYGLGDISASLKYLLIPQSRSIPAVVLRLEAGFPTGNEHLGLGTGAYEVTPFAAFLKDFGGFVLQGNFGWSKQVTGQQTDIWGYNWALAVPLYERKLYGLAEINGDWGSPNHTALSPGIKYLLSDRFSVGVGAPIGLNSSTEAWRIVTQFQFDF